MYRDVEIGYYDCQDSESNPRRCRAPSISISLKVITLLGQLQSTTPSSSRNLVKGQIGKKRLAVTAEVWALILHHDVFCTSGYVTPTPGDKEQKRRTKRDLDLFLTGLSLSLGCRGRDSRVRQPIPRSSFERHFRFFCF